eukprot:scaffold156990_cov31-Tisochrysis_lutea.AAC.2
MSACAPLVRAGAGKSLGVNLMDTAPVLRGGGSGGGAGWVGLTGGGGGTAERAGRPDVGGAVTSSKSGGASSISTIRGPSSSSSSKIGAGTRTRVAVADADAGGAGARGCSSFSASAAFSFALACSIASRDARSASICSWSVYLDSFHVLAFFRSSSAFASFSAAAREAARRLSRSGRASSTSSWPHMPGSALRMRRVTTPPPTLATEYDGEMVPCRSSSRKYGGALSET